MKKLIFILLLFVQTTAQADRISCEEMKYLFGQIMSELHVFGSEEDYLQSMINDPKVWQKAYENLVELYDPEKVFFFEDEVKFTAQNQEDALPMMMDFLEMRRRPLTLTELLLGGSQAAYPNYGGGENGVVPAVYAAQAKGAHEECGFIKGFYKSFIHAFERHQRIVMEAYFKDAKTREVNPEFVADVRALGGKEAKELSQNDRDLFERRAKDAKELQRKVKLKLSRQYRVYSKHYDADTAFATTMKANRLVRSKYGLLENEDKVYNKDKGNEIPGELKFTVWLNAALHALDIHTSYMWNEKVMSFRDQLASGFAGLGLTLDFGAYGMRVVEVIKNGPVAQQGGIEAGDHLMMADGQDLTNISLEDAIKILKGNVGSVAKLKVKHKETVKDVEIVRGIVSVSDQNNKSEIVERNGRKLGYFRLSAFYQPTLDDHQNIIKQGCAADFKDQIEKFNAAGVEGMIIDVRDNGGGSLQEVQDMISYLIKEGPITMQGTAEKIEPYFDEDGGAVLFDKPVIVMVNRGSASASEIFSGVLQEYNRALVVGPEGTYGKGSVQSIIFVGEDLRLVRTWEEAQQLLKVTMAYYYLPSGRSVQGSGVLPDVTLFDGLTEKEEVEFAEVDTYRPEREKNPRLKPSKEVKSYLQETQKWQEDSAFRGAIARGKLALDGVSTADLVTRKKAMAEQVKEASDAGDLEKVLEKFGAEDDLEVNQALSVMEGMLL